MKRSRFWLALIGLTALLAGVSYSQGPLTNAGNLMVRSDSNGSLSVFGVAAGAQGPLTNFSNLRLRTYNGGDLGVTINGGTITPSIGLFGDGTITAPSIAFASQPGLGWYRTAVNNITLATGGVNVASFIGATGLTVTSNRVIGFAAAADSAPGPDTFFSRLATNSVALGNGGIGSVTGALSLTTVSLGATTLTWSAATPGLSGFGGSGPAATVTTGSTTAAFRIGVGGTAPGTTGTITLPTATTGWNCWIVDQTTPLDITRQTSSTTASVSITSTIAWTANDILVGGCAAF